MEPIFKLVYVSQASEQICYSDIREILESAQRRNQENSITGLLIFKDHHFLQILEGPQDQVLETASRILRDRRHHHFKVLVESKANKRTFENWTISFHDGDIQQETSHLIDEVFQTALDQSRKEKESILQMLECFRRSSQQFSGKEQLNA